MPGASTETRNRQQRLLPSIAGDGTHDKQFKAIAEEDSSTAYRCDELFAVMYEYAVDKAA